MLQPFPEFLQPIDRYWSLLSIQNKMGTIGRGITWLWRHKAWRNLKIAIFLWKFQHFAIKILHIRISLFCLYRRKMTIQIYSVIFTLILRKYFSKWRLKISKKWKKITTTPSPFAFDGLPYPRVRWYPHFVSSSKWPQGCEKDHLYVIDHFL